MRSRYSAFRILHSALNQSTITGRGFEHLRLQLDVPVGLADELGPGGDRGMARGVERLPLGARRLAVEPHVGLLRRAVGLLLVAGDAGQHAVLPGAGAAARAGHDVVDRQRVEPGPRTAVLAGLAVPLEQVAAV